MKSYQDTLPFILFGRIVGAACAVMRRSPYSEQAGSNWYRPSSTEIWNPELVDDTTLVYTRRNHPGATIVARNLQVRNLADIEVSEPVVVKEAVDERYSINVRVPAGQSFNVKLQHKFSETKTLLESAEVGLKLGFEASVGYTPGSATGGVTGGVKFTAEASAAYKRAWGNNTTTEDTIDLTLPVQGPFIGQVSAVRAVSDLSVTSKLTPDFEFQVEIQNNGGKLYGWDSYAELIRVLKGEAPTNRDLSKEFVHDPLDENSLGGISDARIKSFSARKIPVISFGSKFQDVKALRIEYIPDKAAMEKAGKSGEE